MSGRRERASLLPNANNPQLLIRLVGLVAAGIRRPRALAEVLEIEVRTVHYYTQAAAWLGLLDGVKELQLTRHGLELAFAEPQHRLRHFAAAVWRNDAARELLQGRPALPSREDIAAWITAQDPELAASTALRRASAVRALIAPAFGRRPSPRRPSSEQLLLPFAVGEPDAPRLRLPRQPRPVDTRAGFDENPDVYARIQLALLEHGELRTGHLRALLDEMGARDAALGTYVDMALRRGDAVREGEKLVVTAGAVRRRELAGDGALVALTDPAYREWLAQARRAGRTPMDQRLHQRLARRYAAWDRRIFGGTPDAESIDRKLDALLPGRLADRLPTAEDTGPPLARTTGAYVDNIDQQGMLVAFPRTVTAFAGGVSAVNSLLRRNRAAPAGVRLPDGVEAPRRAHGGLAAPGEDPLRAVPDTFSLRLRLLTTCPALALLTALLVLDRRPDLGLRLREGGAGLLVRFGKLEVGPLMPSLVAFSAAAGHVVAVPPQGALDGPTLVAVARSLGLASKVGRRVVLSEDMFARLQEDPESRLVYDSLLPVVDRVLAWLQGLDAPVMAGGA